MAKRATKQEAKMKRTTTSKTRSIKRPAAKKLETKSTEANKKALWETYRELQSRVDTALEKLRTHFKTRATPNVLLKDKQELLLLLGECNYMARTCAQLEPKKKGR